MMMTEHQNIKQSAFFFLEYGTEKLAVKRVKLNLIVSASTLSKFYCQSIYCMIRCWPVTSYGIIRHDFCLLLGFWGILAKTKLLYDQLRPTVRLTCSMQHVHSANQSSANFSAPG